MKKLLIIASLAMAILFTGCEKKDEVNIDPRLEFVGAYSLNVSGSATVTNGNKSAQWDLSATNKNFIIELDQTDNTKLNVSGYYGNASATISNGYLCINECSGSKYTSGVYIVLTATHDKASLQNNKLIWTSFVQIAGVGAATLYGNGTVSNVATKQ